MLHESALSQRHSRQFGTRREFSLPFSKSKDHVRPRPRMSQARRFIILAYTPGATHRVRSALLRKKPAAAAACTHLANPCVAFRNDSDGRNDLGRYHDVWPRQRRDTLFAPDRLPTLRTRRESALPIKCPVTTLLRRIFLADTLTHPPALLVPVP